MLGTGQKSNSSAFHLTLGDCTGCHKVAQSYSRVTSRFFEQQMENPVESVGVLRIIGSRRDGGSAVGSQSESPGSAFSRAAATELNNSFYDLSLSLFYELKIICIVSIAEPSSLKTNFKWLRSGALECKGLK
ncbi:hypothetical protein ANTRET_LOCUS4598 [Anthophora retusa]